jgi:hypothetical protein
MIDTVPTPQEISGDFSQTDVNIYDPTHHRAQFQYKGELNVIPPTQINGAARAFLQKYVPQPNIMPGDAVRGSHHGQPGSCRCWCGLQQLPGRPQRTRGK